MRGTVSSIKGGRGSGPGKQPVICYPVVLATSHVLILGTGFVNMPVRLQHWEQKIRQKRDSFILQSKGSLTIVHRLIPSLDIATYNGNHSKQLDSRQQDLNRISGKMPEKILFEMKGFEVSFKQDSPPAWTQEAYRPSCSKSLAGRGGGGVTYLGQGEVPTLAGEYLP